MKKFPTVSKMAAVAAIAAFVFSNSYATSATIQNGDFETYIVESDSFAFWKSDKDATGGTLFDISQETTAPASGTGALKMEIMAGTDPSTECRISTEIKNLPALKLFTVTAKVKYSDMPAYWNSMFSLQQATLLQEPPWTWTDRKWLSMWGNDSGSVADWVPISMTDTTADSANVFSLIISLSKSGTLWVDDIAITYTDIAPVTQKAVTPARQGAILNNRISFPRAMPYSLEACGVNGKMILKTSGVANAVNLDRLGLVSGAYLVKAKTSERTYNGRVVVGR
jgi:hypothetical protein